jgi:uncharacterized phage protein (TIGR01671 family)
MREILFKGKRKDNGEWVEGIPIKNKLGIFICYEKNPHYCSQYYYMEIQEIAEVDPDTVCQYTGLTDRNNEKIFENDIVTSAEFCPDNEGYGVIEWQDDEAMFVVDADTCYYDFDHIFGAELEVIGNVFDNRELIQGVEE